MNKYDQLKNECADLSGFVASQIRPFNKGEFLRYLLSGALKIWGSHGLYSPDYAEALAAITGKQYTPEQVLTALSCCGDDERDLRIPEFFKKIVAKDCSNGTDASGNFIEKLNSIFVSTAFINGDFTINEANELSRIIDELKEHCSARGLVLPDLDTDVSDKVTAANRESYLKRIPPAEPSPMSVFAGNGPSEGGALHGALPEGDTAASEPFNITVTLELGGNNSPDMEGPTTDGRAEPSPAVSMPTEGANKTTLDSLLAELDSLVGLETVKRDVHSLLNFIKVAKIREARGMKVPVVSYHLVFTGNPGTGKTTVARLVAQLYFHMGILPQGQLVETDRSALVAGYLGQTAIKTQKVISQALGGVLFIDEAYSLAGETDDSYGREAVETILKAMEDHRDELVVIVAGYDELMHRFIDSNPGLASRFSKYFFFPDYNGEELLKIFLRFCSSNGYTIEENVSAMLSDRFLEMYRAREEHFGNARAVRNLFEKAINCQADRIAGLPSLSDTDLERITCADIDAAMGGE